MQRELSLATVTSLATATALWRRRQLGLHLRFYVLGLALGLGLPGSPQGQAQTVPESMNYQGYVTAGSVPLSGPQTLTFKLFNDVDEAEGEVIWGPQAFDGGTGTGHGPQALFAEGRFNVTLREDTDGDLIGVALAANAFPDGCWLEIKVGTNVPMPRQQLLAAPFAFVAADALVAADVRHDALSLTTTGATVTGTVTATNGFAGFGVVPIGSIIAWHKSLPGVPALPAGWVECNGQTLSDPASPLNSQVIPNLNSAGRFLRGGSTSGVQQTDALQDHKHLDNGHSHSSNNFSTKGNPDGSGDRTANYYFMHPDRGTDYSLPIKTGSADLSGPTVASGGTPRTASETRPVNMSVVWVMRVK